MIHPVVRPAPHAGTWYPETRTEIESFMQPGLKKRKAVAVVCPHAGWIYSGKVAGEVFSSVLPADRYVLVGPNHRGAGPAVSIYAEGSWETPLGILGVDAPLARAISAGAGGIVQPDTLAHREEHSLEVQLPFIKLANPHARIVPISLFDYRLHTCRTLGDAIARAVSAHDNDGSTLLVASTDMSHYISAEEAQEADRPAIDRILHLDPAGLLKAVEDNEITMCGSGPTAAVLFAALALGARQASLVRYTNSGATTGDNDQVVAYAGFVIS
jgi:AmmeMemoRadiSam system protein B